MTDIVAIVACGCCSVPREIAKICTWCTPNEYCRRCSRCLRHCCCFNWLRLADAGATCQACNESIDVVTLTLADGDGVRLCVKCLEVACEFAQP